MTSTYRGYTIDHSRTGAQAWKGEQCNRMPDVIGHDLADAMYKINIFEDYDAAHPVTPDVVVPV